ncbi:MAG: polysaccharide pyruvyl transferase family protein [Oscillospiraceae bacterium]|nr:polysaccharide pyruvyl transferase family protein [Oscillospiraceae bacterium]
MKYGIITLFQNYNYGATLQSYALQRIVKEYGYDVETIQYERTAINTNKTGIFNKLTPRKIFCFLAKKIKSTKIKKDNSIFIENDDSIRRYLFDSFIKENMLISKHAYTKSTIAESNRIYQGFICGSDNIWNKNLFDSSFMLDFADEKKRKIAYAPGMSTDHLSKKQQDLFLPPIRRLDYLSCREKIGASLLEKLIKKEVKVVLDPTLLLSKEQWSEISVSPDINLPPRYAFAYICDHNTLTDIKIKEISKRLNLPIVLVPNMGGEFKLFGAESVFKVNNVGPAEFIYLVKNSNLVLTDSFHGTVFACLFEKIFMLLEDFPIQIECS